MQSVYSKVPAGWDINITEWGIRNLEIPKLGMTQNRLRIIDLIDNWEDRGFKPFLKVLAWPRFEHAYDNITY